MHNFALIKHGEDMKGGEISGQSLLEESQRKHGLWHVVHGSEAKDEWGFVKQRLTHLRIPLIIGKSNYDIQEYIQDLL